MTLSRFVFSLLLLLVIVLESPLPPHTLIVLGIFPPFYSLAFLFLTEEEKALRETFVSTFDDGARKRHRQKQASLFVPSSSSL